MAQSKIGPPTLNEVKNVSNVEEALAIQAKIEPLVQIPIDHHSQIQSGRINILALDVAYSTQSDLIVASGVLCRHDRKRDSDILKDSIIAEKVLSGKVKFPYIPGLLAFREIPILSSIIEELLPLIPNDGKTLLLCDGAGIAHPRLCGIASHLGVLYDLPSIGVAKNHLIGTSTLETEADLKSERGSHSMLYVDGKEVGSVLRSQDGVRPIFVSPGHLISIKEAREIVLDLCQKYRLPEPIRRADHIGRLELKRIETIAK